MRIRPVSPSRLVAELAARIVAERTEAPVRVAVDGPEAADPAALADALVDPLRVHGRPALRIRAEDFLRPASVRLELGRTNPDSRYERWLDEPGLRREVLDRAAAGAVLPSLWDPVTDRATRAAYAPVPPSAVVLVSGGLMLGGGLPFEVTIHLALSPGALRRRTPPAQLWTLPAYARYDAEVGPASFADVVVRYDDPRHPAVVEPAVPDG